MTMARRPVAVSARVASRDRDPLRADCARCAGLCCVAPGFTASAEFAIDKPAGRPCPNLSAQFRCGVHGQLHQLGFRGCAAYDCFGAGQRVSQALFGGRDWRTAPAIATQMFDAFAVMRQLHELLWYLREALRQARPASLRAALVDARDATERIAALPADRLVVFDVVAHRRAVGELLQQVSDHVRAAHRAAIDARGAHPVRAARTAAIDLRGADLIGAQLAGADLRAASLRGARVIAADLRGADLRFADLLGTDLRGARLGGADLRGALFLVAAQLATAEGDATTRLPRGLPRPAHWPAKRGQLTARTNAITP
jgi:uncharacterized protein YjbI with pentapeptide repeats